MTAIAERSYRTMDKTGWGDGPWNDEPDKLQWIDEATGLDCLIVRNPLGALCGYVGVPSGHPWHGREYSRTDSGGDGWDEDAGDHGTRPDSIVDVHGGLTYSDGCQENAPEAEAICHVPAPGRPKDVWWFGFDCAHHCDVSPGMEARMAAGGYSMPHLREPYQAYRTVGYVRRECAKLAAQLETVESSLAHHEAESAE